MLVLLRNGGRGGFPYRGLRLRPTQGRPDLVEGAFQLTHAPVRLGRTLRSRPAGWQRGVPSLLFSFLSSRKLKEDIEQDEQQGEECFKIHGCE